MWSEFNKAWRDRLVRLCMLCIACVGISSAAAAPFLSIIGIEILGFGPAQYALIISLGGVLSVASSVFVGIYLDRKGKYSVALLMCGLIGAVAVMGMFLRPSQIMFILAHAVLLPLASANFTQFFALANIAGTRNKELDRDFALFLTRAIFSIAYGLTPPIVAIAIAAGFGVMAVYALCSAMSMILLVLIFTGMSSGLTDIEASAGLPLTKTLQDITRGAILWRIGLISVIIAVNALSDILVGLLILNSLGGSAPDVGWYLGFMALLEVPAMIWSARLVRRYTKSAMVFAGGAVFSLFLASFAAMPNMFWAWPLMIFGGLGGGMLLSVTIAYVQELLPQRPGTGSSFVTVTHFMGTLIASGTFALGASLGGYEITAWLGAALGIIACILLLGADGWTCRVRPAARGAAGS